MRKGQNKVKQARYCLLQFKSIGQSFNMKYVDKIILFSLADLS